MTSSILIGKLIYKLLVDDAELNESIGDRVYPVVANEGTQVPYAVFTRDNVTSAGSTKDGYYEDQVEFSVLIVSNEYNTSAEIANRVRYILEKPKISIEDLGLTVYYVSLSSAEEQYVDDSFIQRLTFNCKIN